MNRTITALAATLVLAVAGCGGDDEPAGSSGGSSSTPAAGSGETLQLAAPEDGSLKFDETELDAAAGTVTIDFDNPSATPHAVAIEGDGVEEASDTVTSSTTSVTADLDPGTYTFYCPVGNHRQGGMEGTLTVE
jgi:plastocyanin